MGGVSRGMRGTGGRSILVRIPWTPRAARKSRIAARARRKQPYFAESADLALWGSPGAALAAPRRAARPSHRGHVCMRRFHGPGVEVRRDRAPGARPERRFDYERKRPTRRRVAPGRAPGAVGLGFRAGGAEGRRGPLEAFVGDRNVDPARAAAGRERASGARRRGTARGPGAGRRARVRRRRRARRASGPRNRSPTPRRLREGARWRTLVNAMRWCHLGIFKAQKLPLKGPCAHPVARFRRTRPLIPR